MSILPKLPPRPPAHHIAGYVRHPFFRGFTRCFGMVFTKTDLDTFPATCSSTLSLLDGLLKSRPPLAGARVFAGSLAMTGSSSVDSRVGDIVVSVVQDPEAADAMSHLMLRVVAMCMTLVYNAYHPLHGSDGASPTAVGTALPKSRNPYLRWYCERVYK